MRSIVIGGSLAQKPGRGGHTWVLLQYLLGFQKLGWDVLFVDRLEPDMCMDDAGMPCPIEDSWNVAYFLQVMHRFSLDGRFAILCAGGRTIGLDRAAVIERVAASAALINVMGFINDAEILSAAPKKVFLDIDPGFGQMWRALGLHDAFAGHDAYVTIGQNIGRPGCGIPTCGLDWITTLPPVVMDEWPAVESGRGAARSITTVASWRGSYGPVAYEGTMYGLRAHEFRRFASLPRLTNGRFEIALDIHPADVKDVELLDGNGWSLVEPRSAAGDPWRYREFIGASMAEVMIAKGMYVQTRSGWFSDRSVCYLAAGRPVLAQDTGFGDVIPTGEGLLAFSTLEEAREATHAIDRDYAAHARAARSVAEECFDSSKVLAALTRSLRL